MGMTSVMSKMFEKKEKKVEKKLKKRIPSKEELELKERFREVMFELDLYNKFKKTYYLDVKKETNYGFYAHLYLATGLSFNEIQDKRITVEQNLNCMWIMKTEPFRAYAELQIVLNPVDENVAYENPNLKPNEFYLGRSFSNKIQKANVDDDKCMFLLAGATGSGKTRFMYLVLLSWILGCTPKEVGIYLSDIAKNEYIQFKNVKHVKSYASELEELKDMMAELMKEYSRRKKILDVYREKGIATNIAEYNKINKSKKLSYCYIVVDEASIVQKDGTDTKDEKEQKEYIISTLKRFSKLGRGLGMFTFIATQKTVREEIDSIFKNMSSVRISFRANDQISSEVIMGNDSALGLPSRVAAYSLNGGTTIDYLYVPKITTEMLKELLEPYIENKQTLAGRANNAPNDGVTSKTIVTRIPKGVSYKEFLESYKSDLNNEGVKYNDY